MPNQRPGRHRRPRRPIPWTKVIDVVTSFGMRVVEVIVRVHQ
jgi:hypothetical protein